jgi:hypothetical protein
MNYIIFFTTCSFIFLLNLRYTFNYNYLNFIKLNNFFFLKNFSFFNIIIKNSFKLNQFKILNNNNLLNINNNYKFNFFKSNLISNSSISLKPFLTRKNNSNLKNFFTLIFILNLSLYNSKFKPNFNFKLFYISENSKNLLIIDSTKFINR